MYVRGCGLGSGEENDVYSKLMEPCSIEKILEIDSRIGKFIRLCNNTYVGFIDRNFPINIEIFLWSLL